MKSDIEKAKALMEILRTEYGITTLQELDAAIEKQKKLDISVFCVPLDQALNNKKEDLPK